MTHSDTALLIAALDTLGKTITLDPEALDAANGGRRSFIVWEHEGKVHLKAGPRPGGDD